jgi:hypothetical protein
MLHSLRRLLPVTLPFVLGVAPSPRPADAHADAEQRTALVGGTGGTSYRIKCPSGSVLVGFEAHVGQWIDGILALQCQQVKADGTLGVVTRSSGAAGGSMGSIVSGRCPAGSVIASYRGRYGQYVHQIYGHCFSWKATRRFDRYAEKTPAASVGGALHPPGATMNGGECTKPYQPAVGIYGRAAMYLDSFGLICDEP